MAKSDPEVRLAAWMRIDQRGFPLVTGVAAALVIAFGAVVLAGWAVGSPTLIRVLPTELVMKPLTAALFILAGVALWCVGGQQSRSARECRVAGMVCGLVVSLVGAMRLSDYLFGLGLNIDLLSFSARVASPGGFPPSELAPNTSLSLLFCGLAVVVFEWETSRGFRPSQALVLASGLIALLALIGYAYRVLLLSNLGTDVPMSLDSAIEFALFCLGFMAARPHRGFMRIITSRTAGGAIARRLLPMAILIPAVLGAVLLLGEEAGHFEREFAVSMFAVASILIFTALIWWNARLLHGADLERVRTERRLSAQHQASRLLAESGDLAQAMPGILRVIGQSLGWQVGALWTLDEHSQTLRCSETWQDPAADMHEFVAQTRQGSFARGESLPGRVWAEGQPVWIPDVVKDQGFLRAPVAGKADLHGAFGFPIRLGQETFGVIEFYSRRIEPRDAPLLDMLSTVGTQMGLFVERTRAEQQLRQATAELQRSNTDLQQFAYVASHDLFEPLRMVTSYLQLLAERSRDRLDPMSLEFLGFALDGAKRMDALINDLLAYSRVGIRGRPLEPTNTEQVFQAALSNLKVALDESGAKVEHQPLPMVRGDRVQLTQVLQNLIGNAIKFHGPEAPRIEVGAERRDGEWLFTVRDNGIGIEPKHFERIFVIFQRLHTRQEYAGTGMGLAICKKIIERHGGRIWVESARGKGATFLFTLPALEEEAKNPP